MMIWTTYDVGMLGMIKSILKGFIATPGSLCDFPIRNTCGILTMNLVVASTLLLSVRFAISSYWPYENYQLSEELIWMAQDTGASDRGTVDKPFEIGDILFLFSLSVWPNHTSLRSLKHLMIQKRRNRYQHSAKKSFTSRLKRHAFSKVSWTRKVGSQLPQLLYFDDSRSVRLSILTRCRRFIELNHSHTYRTC